MDDLPPTEASNPSTSDLDTLDTRALLQRINDEDGRAAAAVERELDVLAAAVDAIAERLQRGGTLHYFGAGTSGRLGVLDAAEIPPTFSTDPRVVVGHIAGGAAALTHAVEEAEDDEDAGRAEVSASGIGANDVALGLSASGSAAYVIGAMEAANSAGALTVCITSNPRGRLAGCANIPIVLQTGPEALSGSTRMKAAAAQKMALTALSTAVMVKMGKVYGNLMVDLAASNRKLRGRALRLTRAIAGATEPAADEALRASGYRVKVAAVMLVHGCDAEAADALLAACAGSLRKALAKKNADSRG
jgi:N-acetylmuramic acid 6-phosphate etherase